MTAIVRTVEDGVLVLLRVTPRSSRNEVVGVWRAADGARSLAVKVTAPPDKGSANRAVIEVLSEALAQPKLSFAIVAGEANRRKSVRISGNPEKLQASLAVLVANLEG